MDLLPIGSLLSSNPSFLTELEMTGQRIGSKGLSFLSAGIQSTSSLRKLLIPRNGICSVESIATLCYALQTNTSVEVLDLSENNIDDNAAEGLKELLKSNEVLLDVNLDHNLITNTCFAVSLCENRRLTHFSISFNPINFENFISLLEMLNINLTLKFLGLKGVKFAGPANIKENQSGVLEKKEAIILKLANTLRHSSLFSLAIDLDPTAELQLRELETTLLKHNSQLVNISSDTINWRVPQQGPLLGIQRALKANSWLKRNEQAFDEEIPSDIENIVAAKLAPGKNSKHFRDIPGFLEESTYSNPQFVSIESPPFSSSHINSPVFSANTPLASDTRYSLKPRITRQDSSEKQGHTRPAGDFEEKMLKIIENFNVKIQCFQEEIAGQVNALYERIHDLESTVKRPAEQEYQHLLSRIAELEKKDQSNQNLINLANREISELKASSIPELNKNISTLKQHFNSKFNNFEKKISENHSEIPLLKKHLSELDSKILRINESSYVGSSEARGSNKNFRSGSSSVVPSHDSVHAAAEDLERERGNNSPSPLREGNESTEQKMMVEHIPGTAETMVIKAIQEKNYWSVRKKLDFSRDQSPMYSSVQEFYSPVKCPSRDLHERLVKRGFNFVSRSYSACKKN